MNNGHIGAECTQAGPLTWAQNAQASASTYHNLLGNQNHTLPYKQSFTAELMGMATQPTHQTTRYNPYSNGLAILTGSKQLRTKKTQTDLN